MTNAELLRRIDERLTTLNLSDRAACLRAGLRVDVIRDMRRRGHIPAADKLAALAKALDIAPSYFLDGFDAPETPSHKRDATTAIPLCSIYVKGAVQAGAWVEAVEWPASEWFNVVVPVDPRYPEIERFGLLVRGASMDRLYPDGTIALVVRYVDIGRLPRTGDRVVVLRRSRGSGEYEATLKEYELDAKGRHVLWPRSSAPEFQSPIVLAPGDLPLSGGEEPLPPTAFDASVAQADNGADLLISALVVGSYRAE